MIMKCSASLFLAMAISSVTTAAPVVFENTNPSFAVGYASTLFASTYQPLDLTQDAWNQPPTVLDFGPPAPDGTFYFLYETASSSGTSSYYWVGGSAIDIAIGDPVSTQLNSYGDWIDRTFDVPMNAAAGYVVGAQTAFSSSELHYAVTNSALPSNFLVSDTNLIMPMRFLINGQTHYGFIEIENLAPQDYLAPWNAVRWGFETSANTSFQIPSNCPADLVGDGILDFFDVSAFLTAFSTSDPIADFTGDGSFDFFDVSAFLTAFSTGCP